MKFSIKDFVSKCDHLFIYLRFSSIVWFLQFLSHFLWVLETRSKLSLFYTKFWLNRGRFLASTCTSLLLRSKPVQWNYRDFFWHFKPKSAFLGLKELYWLCKHMKTLEAAKLVFQWIFVLNSVKHKFFHVSTVNLDVKVNFLFFRKLLCGEGSRFLHRSS